MGLKNKKVKKPLKKTKKPSKNEKKPLKKAKKTSKKAKKINKISYTSSSAHTGRSLTESIENENNYTISSVNTSDINMISE